MEKSKDIQDEVRILLIEGFIVEDGVQIRYNLPPLDSEMMQDFYRAFVVQLCENIAKLEGAEYLFDITEDADDGE